MGPSAWSLTWKISIHLFVFIILKWIPSTLVPSSWDLAVTWRLLTYGMPTIQFHRQRANSYGKESYINLHAWPRDSLLLPVSSPNLWNLCSRSSGSWDIHQAATLMTPFNRILPWRVPSQHWWYPNPVSRLGFLASWSQISGNTNPGLASPWVCFKFSGYKSIHFSR